jgi:hypothetical protein
VKGLTSIPTVSDLSEAYRKLQGGLEAVSAISIEEWALWSQWSRFDPRLAEQWIAGLVSRWKTIAPTALNEALRALPWPAAAGVLLDQAHAYEFHGDAPGTQRLFQDWSRCVMSGVEPAEGELFFLGLRAFAGDAMRQDAVRALKPFRRWGYFGRELLVNKAASRRGRTLVPSEVRRQVLEELLRSRPRISVRDYMESLDWAVSRRQAELDLQKFRKLRAFGNTRNRFYRLKS